MLIYILNCSAQVLPQREAKSRLLGSEFPAPSLAIGICIKEIGPDLHTLINSSPKGLTFIIVSGREESFDKSLFPSENNYIYYSVPDSTYGYDLVRNRKLIFDEFNRLSLDLLLYLDDDEFFPPCINEFANFYSSGKSVGMLSHSNLYMGEAYYLSGTNYHARLLRRGGFPLEGKVIESVSNGFSKYFMKTKIPHEFYRKGFEYFILRGNRWAKESALSHYLGEAKSMRPYMKKVRTILGPLSPLARFLYHYIYMGGFRNGAIGYYLSMNYAFGEYMRDAYLFEMRQFAKVQQQSAGDEKFA